MKSRYITISFIASLLGLLVFFAQDELKDFLRNHLPFHSKAHVYKILQDREIFYTKKVFAYNGMRDYFVVPSKPMLIRVQNHNYFASDDISLDVFQTNLLKKIKNSKAKGGTYLSLHQNDLVIAQENGIFFSVPIDKIDASTNSMPLKHIPSNLFSIIDFFDFYGPGQYGMKGMYADQRDIYIAVSYMKEPNCFNTSILKAEMNKNFLDFKVFFIPNQCVKIINEYGEYNASDSGGRIAGFKNNKILFSSGSFRYRDLAQDQNSHLGKILSIDKNTASAKVISMGHRNVMGLTYSSKNDEILSTEHGPNGGDEINLNISLDAIKPVNFGWPISSYGGHYSASSFNPEGALIVDLDSELYKKAPLYKSHQKYGFQEPLVFFTPSIGISAIQYIDNNFFGENNFNVIFGSKGSNKDALDEKSLYLFNSLNKSKKKVFRGERVRDILVLEEKSMIIFTGETTGIIAILQNKK
jgi:glucose/arabinose dehydrogenase